jgi:phospholipase/carboxylesterase
MNHPHHPLGPLREDPAFEFAYRLRQPAPERPVACVLLLHGVGGGETDLASLAAQLPADILVLLARGPLLMAPGQYAWFRVSFTAAGPSIVAAEAHSSRLRLIRFVEQIQAAHGIAPRHTVIAGFSQGGIMSAGTALCAPERVAGFGVLSGRILPEIKPHLASGERLAHVRAFIGHGELDRTLPVMWAQRSAAWLTELGVPHEAHVYPVGHAISPAMRADFVVWVGATLAAVPQAV